MIAGDLDKYAALENGYEVPKPMGVSPEGKGIISGTSNPLAVHAGQQCLLQGGNAADCAVAASLAQVRV